MGMIILNSLKIFFAGSNYLTYVFLLTFAFGSLFRLIGVERWKKYTHFR